MVQLIEWNNLRNTDLIFNSCFLIFALLRLNLSYVRSLNGKCKLDSLTNILVTLASLIIGLFISNLCGGFHAGYDSAYIVLDSSLSSVQCTQCQVLFLIMKFLKLLFINCPEKMLNKQTITKLWFKTKRLVPTEYRCNDSKRKPK